MAGYTAPKSDEQRVRRNKLAPGGRTIQSVPTESYALPEDLLPVEDGIRESWHPATLRWWRRWSESPLAASLPAVDWSELEATAVLHHEFMRKRTFTLASELRLRMQKFGATPEDRMRLRILVADADEKDGGDAAHRASGAAAKARFGGLRAVGD